MSFEKFDTILPSLAFDGDKAGGSLVIFKQGELAYQTAFGQANAHAVWTPHSLSVNFSIGKGVMATLVAVLVSRGVLDYDTPISHCWADFRVNGKENITLMDVLTHTAGLYNIRSVMRENDEITDWQGMLAKVAQMPISTPKDQETHAYASAYSALVSGWVLGGVIERVTGKPLQSVLDDCLAEPLGVKGALYFGLPSEQYDRLVLPEFLWHDQNQRRKPTLKPDSQKTLDFYKNLPIAHLWGETLNTQAINRHYFDPSRMNLANYKDALLADGKTPINYHSQAVVSVPVPAANGVSSAHALATLYAMHANGGVWRGETLIDPSTLAKLRTVRTQGFDAVMPADMRWRAGFHRLFSVQNAPNAYGHMGYNGSVAFCDPDRGLSVAFIHNFDTTMLNDVRQFVVSEMALLLS
ncbi:MAG: serine hydrolase domain-containing protein [Moraxella sp.]|nr:serine hydrolase domain-containing protein [Moraxella sp.]